MGDPASESKARLEWKEAVTDLQTGRGTAAVDRLRRLYDISPTLSPNLRMDISYTYGVSLLRKPSITFDARRAREVLQSLVDRRGYGSEQWSEGQSRC